MRGLRLEVSIYNVYITSQFQTAFSQGGREEKNTLAEVSVNSKEIRLLSQLRPRIPPQIMTADAYNVAKI